MTRITSWDFPGDTDVCVVMTYTAMTLRILGGLESPTRWPYVKNTLDKLDTYKVPAGRVGSDKDNSPWGIPTWSKETLTYSLRELARLAHERQVSGTTDRGNSETELRDVVVLMEKLLVHVRDQVSPSVFTSDNRTAWSFKEALDMVIEAKHTFDPEGEVQP